jgi:aminopeptidase-like protein
LEGATDEEILLSCHACHPWLCNDNLSGIAVATFLGRQLARVSRRYTYRLLFIPGTIGSITWLALNEERIPFIRHGLVVTCVGDAGRSTYKRTRRGDAEVDLAAAHVLKHAGDEYEIQDFFPYGYDERQYGSPGINLDVGCLMRTPHGRYPEYHTSADGLHFVKPDCLRDSLLKCWSILSVLENNRTYRNLYPKCEPQLGRRGLYAAIGGDNEAKTRQLAMLWVLNQSDAQHSLLDIADRSGLPFETVRKVADVLQESGLLEECAPT